MTSAAQYKRHELVGFHALVQVVNGRAADARVLTVDLADEAFEVLAFALVVRVFLAARHRDLHHDVTRRVERAVGEQLTDGSQPPIDALRVVETIHSEQDELRIAELGAELARPGLHGGIARLLHQRGSVDRDRKRADADLRGPRSAPSRPFPWRRRRGGASRAKFDAAARYLEPHEVGAEESLEDLPPPRKLQEQLAGRERDVQEVPDPHVGSELPQHRGTSWSW